MHLWQLQIKTQVAVGPPDRQQSQLEEEGAGVCSQSSQCLPVLYPLELKRNSGQDHTVSGVFCSVPSRNLPMDFV